MQNKINIESINALINQAVALLPPDTVKATAIFSAKGVGVSITVIDRTIAYEQDDELVYIKYDNKSSQSKDFINALDNGVEGEWITGFQITVTPEGTHWTLSGFTPLGAPAGADETPNE